MISRAPEMLLPDKLPSTLKINEICGKKIFSSKFVVFKKERIKLDEIIHSISIMLPK